MSFLGRTGRHGALALAVTLTVGGVLVSTAAWPVQQSNSNEQVSEVVATLATGQVTIISARDGMVIAAVGNSFEPDSLPPMIVQVNDTDVAIILGADDWTEPAPAGRTLLRLDQQFPRLLGGMAGNTPSLRAATGNPHLEQLGMAVLEPLRAAARNLHAQLNLPPDLPLAEIVLVRQTEEEPLSVWDLSYWIRQTFWQENFWDTEVERPRSIQLYPTQQDRSGTVQVSYPPGDATAGPLGWISHPIGRFAQTVETDPKLAEAQKQIADGDARKTRMEQLVPLVKAALETMAPATAEKAMAAVDQKTGFVWVIQPPVSRIVVARPSGAPTLETPPDRE